MKTYATEEVPGTASAYIYAETQEDAEAVADYWRRHHLVPPTFAVLGELHERGSFNVDKTDDDRDRNPSGNDR